MTPARQPSTVRAPRDTPPPAFPLHVAGAALLPAALEACRQHERVAPLIEKGCAEAELREAAAVCELSDHHLAARTKDYEAVAAVGKGTTPDDVWRAANTLWHSSREYARRHRSCDALMTKLRKQLNAHSSDKFSEITLEYELEASALLALEARSFPSSPGCASRRRLPPRGPARSPTSDFRGYG